MSTISYGWEKLYLAILTLTGSGPIQDRLISAWIYHLSHIRPEENLPEELREEFIKLEENLNREEPFGNEGSIRATINKMDKSEIKDSVEKIVSLFSRIAKYKP